MKSAIRKQMKEARERDYIAWAEMDEEPWPMPKRQEYEPWGSVDDRDSAEGSAKEDESP
jgi:hypothetical protein